MRAYAAYYARRIAVQAHLSTSYAAAYPVRLRYDSLFIVHDHGGGFLVAGRSYFQDRHFTRQGCLSVRDAD